MLRARRRGWGIAKSFQSPEITRCGIDIKAVGEVSIDLEPSTLLSPPFSGIYLNI